MHIRQARAEDVPAMVDLAAQLGYAIPPAEFSRRLEAYADRADGTALIAVEEGRAVGFASGGLRLDLLCPPTVELEALVVHENARNRGVGRGLIVAFEGWASGQGAEYVKLGTREPRKDAHRFYLRDGYELVKVHHIMRKRL